MFSLGMNLLYLVVSLVLAVIYSAEMSTLNGIASILFVAMATVNLGYWVYRFRSVRNERDQFLISHGWNFTNKIQGKTKLWFKSGQGKDDLFFIFIVNFQPESYRMSDLTYKRINEKYMAHFNNDICIIEDYQTKSMSLHRKMK